jgi:hypothetical protein
MQIWYFHKFLESLDKNLPKIMILVLDRCYNNTICGRNGECINLPHKKSFECRCRLFYDGEKCEKCNLFPNLITIDYLVD